MRDNQVKLNKEEKRIITLSAIGGMLEFYDFIIYGVFSVYFAHQFFPSNQALISVIESYVVFVLGYIARPIGGIFFSHIGDEYGRKKVLVITIVLMGVSSLGIGLLPTYNHIGIMAPLSLLALRLLQGVALGGELPSTYVYISESIPHKRGISIGLTMSGVNGGLLLGMVINQVLNLILTVPQLNSYGWRIPFIFGGVVCLISYKIRKTLQETEVFTRISNKSEFPLMDLFKNYLSQFMIGVAFTAIMSATVVTSIIFMPTYLHTLLHIKNQVISEVLLFGMIVNVITIYYIGRLADIISPYIIMRNLLIISIVAIPFSYLFISYGGGFVTLGVIILCVIEAVAAMVVPLLVTCLFPAKIRLTGVAMSYNIGFTIFGGVAPILISYLIRLGYGIFITPISYLIIIVLICAVGLICTRRYSAGAD